MEAPGFPKASDDAPNNVAIVVARICGQAAFVGKLGDDKFGHMQARILKENGVRIEGITFNQVVDIVLMLVTQRSNGEHESMFYRNPSVAMPLKLKELNLELYSLYLALPLEPKCRCIHDDDCHGIWKKIGMVGRNEIFMKKMADKIIQRR